MSDVAPQYINPFAEVVWFIDRDRVNLDDFFPRGKFIGGTIVRCEGDPHTAVMPVTRGGDEFGYVAGMVSENP